MRRGLLLLGLGMLLSARSDPACCGEPPLELEAAVRRALQVSPAVAAARSEMELALLGVARSRPGLRPEVVARASQTFRTPRVDLPGKPDDVIFPSAAGRFAVELRMPLYQFGVGGAPGRRAEAMDAAARALLDQARLDVALEVRESYLGVMEARALARAAAEAADLARAHVATMRRLVDAGLRSRADLLETERSELTARSAQVRADGAAQLAAANLNRLLERPPDAPLLIGSAPATAPAPTVEKPESLAERAFRQRPEHAALRARIEEGRAGIRLAKAARQPRLSLEAAYALQTPTVLEPRSGVAAGVSLSMPIWEGSGQRLTVAEAEGRVKQLEEQLRALEGAIRLEIERQRLASRTAAAQAALAEAAVAAATEALEIVRFRLEAGRAGPLEVENARVGLARAQSDLVVARVDLQRAAVRLRRALGEPEP